MCCLQQFSSYYSPLLLGTVPDNALSRRTKKGLMTSLAVLPKLGSQYWFEDNPVVQPDPQFLQRTGSRQWKAHQPCFTSSIQWGSKTSHELIPGGRRSFDWDENMNEHQRISMERNIAWEVHSLIVNTALIPPEYFPVLTALLTSPLHQMTK